MKRFLSLLLFLLAFSYSQAQEVKVLKKAVNKNTVQPKLEKVSNRSATLQTAASRHSNLQLIDKKLASRFQRVENYPSLLNQPKNGNTVKAVYKNNNGVYRIQYNAHNEKEYNYYTDESAMLSEYEIFELLRGFNDYQETQESNLLRAFNEVGIKTLNGAELLKVELNSKKVRKATYQGTDNRSIIVYADDSHTNWLKDGVYSTKRH